MGGAAEFGASAIARTATGCHTLVIGAQVGASLYRRRNSRSFGMALDIGYVSAVGAGAISFLSP
ncbi:MAG: hypothetical protein E5W64_16725, partial [Mesorhizobium sp.]